MLPDSCLQCTASPLHPSHWGEGEGGREGGREEGREGEREGGREEGREGEGGREGEKGGGRGREGGGEEGGTGRDQNTRKLLQSHFRQVENVLHQLFREYDHQQVNVPSKTIKTKTTLILYMGGYSLIEI